VRARCIGELAVWYTADPCLDSVRHYASHAHKTPLILPLRPPDPPPPPPTHPPPPQPKPPTTPTPSPSALPKPRLDCARFLADPVLTTTNHLTRASRLPLGKDHLAHLQRLRSTQLLLLIKLQTIRAKQREIGEVIRSNLADREDSLRQAKKLKTRIGGYESTLSDTEAELLELELALPNFTHPSVPIGGEDKAVELERFGPDPIPADPNRDHLRIANHYGLLDNEASTVATGSSWPYLRGSLALLEMAIINYAVSVALRHGYQPVIPPDVIRTDIAWRCGFQPRDSPSAGPSQTYHLQTPEGSPELCLAGTAELPLSAMLANQVLSYESLPQRVVGIGRAFRAEAGARGTDTRGLYRVHQFTKVELCAVCEGGASEGVMEEMRAVQAEIARGLGLTVR